MMFDILDKKSTPLPFPRSFSWIIITLVLVYSSKSLALHEIYEDDHLPQKISSISKMNVQELEKLLVNNHVIDQCNGNYKKSNNFFGWTDYAVLSTMLIVSCGIGVFYGFFTGKQETSEDFLLGGSCMGTFPMALSLAASFVTAIELLGNPAEMYMYGSQFWMICVAFLLVVPITSKFYLPVFMKLRLTSSYEYLEKRFNSSLRLLASGLYILQMVFYTSVAVYAPALALSDVTGLNVYAAVTVVYVVCIFYASQGGMKAVIMTDTFQAAVLVSSIILILCFGEKFVGGTGIIWSENFNSGRLEIFNMNPNLTIRHSFWSVVIGGMFYWMSMFCSNQASIQKYLSVETISQVRRALWTSSFGLILVYTVNFYMGMILVAHYRDCDPIKSKEIPASDEILPLYIISEMGHLKGMAGFFVAGIFAASLGTVASALNSLSAVTCSDFITGAFGITFPEKKGAMWAKWISFVYGIISFALVFIVERMGSVMQVALSFNGLVGGITLGLFSLGMFFPFANSKGALAGSISAIIVLLWMALGQQIATANGEYVIPQKPTTIDYCDCLNSTVLEEISMTQETGKDDILFIYRISYLWYSAIGFFLTIIIGLIVSFQTGPQNSADVDEDLLSPPAISTYESMPLFMKNWLKIAVKTNKKSSNSVPLKGVVNVSLDISEEVIKK